MRLRLPHPAAALALAASLLPAFAAPLGAAGVHARLQPAAITVTQGQEFDVEIAVFQADGSFNAFDAAIRFDPSRLTFVPAANPATQQGSLMTAACGNRFHVFSAATDSLAASVTLLCSGVTVTGPGVLYKVRFRAGTTSGPTALTLGPSTRFYRAGFFVDPLEAQSTEVCIDACNVAVPETSPGAPGLLPPSPNPWPAGRPGHFAFATTRAGAVRLELFDLGGRKLAARGPEWCEAGRHDWSLSSPDHATGVCFARLVTPDGISSRTVILLR